MKNILFIIEGLHGGGAEKALIELLSHFDYARYSVTLCVVYYGGIYMKQVPSSVKTIYLFDEKRGYWRDSYKRKCLRYYKKYHIEWLMRIAISSKIKDKKFDTIISYIEGLPLVFHNLIRHRAKRNITWVHCDLYHYHWNAYVFKDLKYECECYKNMNQIVFVSRNSMEAFQKLYQISTPQTYLYNLIDVKKIQELSTTRKVSHNSFTITAIGSLIDIKGFDRLIRVAKMFKDHQYSLNIQILGVGDKKDKLLKLCEELNVENMVHFLGFQNPPYPFLATSDILVSTSLSEGLPFVICEAFSLGIPVVATKTAGAIELLENGKYGILTEHDDVSIFEGLKQMVDNKELRELFKKKSAERALIFDTNHTMKSIYKLIEGE